MDYGPAFAAEPLLLSMQRAAQYKGSRQGPEHKGQGSCLSSLQSLHRLCPAAPGLQCCVYWNNNVSHEPGTTEQVDAQENSPRKRAARICSASLPLGSGSPSRSCWEQATARQQLQRCSHMQQCSSRRGHISVEPCGPVIDRPGAPAVSNKSHMNGRL